MRDAGLPPGVAPQKENTMAGRNKDLTAEGETRSDLVFVRLSPTEKLRIRELRSELGLESMSEVVRYLTNTYYEISHRKAS
jgi:hypothetical protein